ncbi:gag-pol polyprotein [Tanacetum coccineum]
MKAILRKDKCLAAIGERPAEVTDNSKWDEMDGNAIANIHLAFQSRWNVLSSIGRESAKEIWDHLARLLRWQRKLIAHNKKYLKRKLYALRMHSQEHAEILLQSLPDSYDQVIINLTSNILSDYLVFDDVVAASEEENSATGGGHCKLAQEGHFRRRFVGVLNTHILREMSLALRRWRCWVYLIKKKSDVFEVFKVYKARVELDSGKKIKCLRTDNGGEYTGDEFDTFCKQEGIKRQFITAYTPQQNGVAERMNRTLLERARAMLATASLGKSL